MLLSMEISRILWINPSSSSQYPTVKTNLINGEVNSDRCTGQVLINSPRTDRVR